jgi:hypothetical protein
MGLPAGYGSNLPRIISRSNRVISRKDATTARENREVSKVRQQEADAETI